MACDEKVVEWALAQANSLNLKVSEGLWCRRSPFDVFDVRSQIEVNGRLYKGAGIAKTFKLAFIKSISEAIERVVAISNGFGTSGVATHSDVELAYINARNELIERDLVLSHFLTGREIGVLECDDAQVFKNLCELKNVRFILCQTDCFNGINAIIAIAHGANASQPFSRILGSAFHLDKRIAIRSAIGECARNVMGFLSASEPEKIHCLTSIEMEETDTNLKLPSEFNVSFSPGWRPRERSTNEIRFEYTPLDHWLLRDSPFKVIRCSNKDLQSHFYGQGSCNKINKTRLQQFEPRLDLLNSLSALSSRKEL